MRVLPEQPAPAAPAPAKPRAVSLRVLCGVLVLLGVGSGIAPAARAQTIYLRDGQIIQARSLHHDGANVVASIQTADGSAGELGYAPASIARIDFPEPPQLKTAGDLLNAGKAGEASSQLAPILAYYAPFRDVAGNWWTPLALLQVDAMARLGKDREVVAYLAELARSAGTNADLLRTVKIKQAAEMERRGEHQPALAASEPLVKDTAVPPGEVVEGWLTIGSARLALRRDKDALLAFLHVPVYTPDRPLLMAPALLGSAKAYIALEDTPRAQAALQELSAAYPNFPEAAEARDELQKLAARPPLSPAH